MRFISIALLAVLTASPLHAGMSAIGGGGIPIGDEPVVVVPDPPGRDVIDRIFQDASDSFSRGDVRPMSKYFASKVFLNLFTGENGYFSDEHSTVIMKNFLATFQPVSFSFSSINRAGMNPYGVGAFTFMRRGQRGTSQVFLSLTSAQGEWRIVQITVTRR